MGTASQRLLIYLPGWKWIPWLPWSPEDTEESVSRAEEERKGGLGMALLVHSVGHRLARHLGEKVLVKSRVRKIRSGKDLAST